MTIALHDLTSLLDDKGTLKRIDALLERLERAERTIAESSKAIEAIDRELEAFGINVGADEVESEGDENAEYGESSALDADTGADAPPPRVTRPAKPRKKPAMPADDPADPRSVVEYANALDEVAHELGAVGTAGATGTRGVDITEAMRRRGFPNGKRVLKVVRAHPCWNEIEGQRSRFRYAAAAVGTRAAAQSRSDDSGDRRANETIDIASPASTSDEITGVDQRAAHADPVEAMTAG